MRYSAADIKWLNNPVEWIRSRPDMFLRGGFHAADMAGRLAGDALIIGALKVVITRHAAWHVISADVDWLSIQPSCHVEPRQAFFQIVAFPEAGVNSMRSEVLLTAFASKVIAASLQDRFTVKGDVAQDDAIWLQMCPEGMVRSIAFQGSD